jgi:hypothetical protein
MSEGGNVSESNKDESATATWRTIQAQVQTLVKKVQEAKTPSRDNKPK